MGKLNKDNFRKTIYYLKKNGIKNTLYAVQERLQKKATDDYTYITPGQEELEKQRSQVWEKPIYFSIIVPLYCTPRKYFKEMVESVLAQSYPYWELVLVDATPQETADTVAVINQQGAVAEENATTLQELVGGYGDARIVYQKLAENQGIAENTNAGIALATGDYIALFDHDDLLTADALYEMACKLKIEKERGIELQMLYSDEDKCNSDASRFYEPHYKPDFNLDLLLSNNYICHFTAVKAELMKELMLRGEYNGAQDFDLVLRVANRYQKHREVIGHVPKILYHWRCHEESTAANPASKHYAYEAGKRAVESFVKENGWRAKVEHLKHLGFYKVVYEPPVLRQRPELGAEGGSLLDKKGRIVGGLQDTQGNVIYKGLPRGFSGYMNRAVLVQEAEMLDVRCMCIRQDCEDIFKKSLQEAGVKLENGVFVSDNGTEINWTELNKKVCEDLKAAGYKLIWNPEWTIY